MAEIANQTNQEPWPPLEMASWWFDKASVLLVVSLVFGLAATVSIVWVGIVKEHHWDILREQSAERIAELNKETARANESAAQANRVAENEKLERIKAQKAIVDELEQIPI